jgi:hypothetical protein
MGSEIYLKAWAITLFVIAGGNWYFPGWSGYFSAPSDVTTGEARIISAICLVGGLILWFCVPKKD